MPPIYPYAPMPPCPLTPPGPPLQNRSVTAQWLARGRDPYEERRFERLSPRPGDWRRAPLKPVIRNKQQRESRLVAGDRERTRHLQPSRHDNRLLSFINGQTQTYVLCAVQKTAQWSDLRRTPVIRVKVGCELQKWRIPDGVEVKEELPKKVRAEELPAGAPLPSGVGYDPIVLSYMWRQYAAMAPSWTATPLVTRDGKALPPPPPAFIRDSVPAPLPAYLSQGPPVLVDPGRVVPLSDSQKFERHYQPNVALAPPKVRDKAARESLKDLSSAHLSQDAHEKIAIYMQEQQQLERGVEVECIKRECSPTPMCLQRPTPNAANPSAPPPPHLRAAPTQPPPPPPPQPHQPQPQHLPRKVCSPDTSSRHPELELSTTDSDTDSVGSVGNRSETVEEAEALLRGWSDRAAASKVAQLVADLAARLAAQERQNAALRQRLDVQTRDHNHAVASLRNQLLSINVTRDTKEEEQLRQKVCAMEGELRALRAELRPRPTPSVIAPTSPVKTEPCDVTDTC
ncbi:uncharacterized protein LOC122256297 [Penaeus japonicus]|uniref:uncharacterized protein LOC122256297 n=1 Tax=Penaeus japonicus TaxID=27405 RepID=UPI001C70E854|nr:uncharacterized protein LOC122256297 [Penaeus japonicus]